MTIETVQLASTAIISATYDEENEELSLTFSNGRTYDYKGVPVDIFQGLKASPSPGGYWHANIKDQYS